MAEQAVVKMNNSVGATCSIHGSITITFTTGSDIVNSLGDGLVRTGDTGTASCGHIATAVTASTITNILGSGLHRVTDTGSMTSHPDDPDGTYTITSSDTPIFSE